MTVRQFCVATSALLLSACGSSPSGPTVTGNPNPTVSCPASIQQEATTSGSQTVTYATPTAVGGQAPVSVVCAPASGAGFPIGSTVVTCTANDTLGRNSSCNFNVTITARPTISKTKFLAFGDSITFGRCNVAPSVCDPYTVGLMSQLTARYADQTFIVTNVGVSGEIASDDISDPVGQVAGQDRLPGELATHAPEVLLLMEGTNDLFFGQSDPNTTFTNALGALDRMVVTAQAAGVSVLLATIPPQRAPAPPGTPNRDVVAALIPSFNDGIRAIAASRGAVLVDVYAAMVDDVPTLIGPDNLHPTEAGIARIGETFYAAIRAAFDTTPTAPRPIS